MENKEITGLTQFLEASTADCRLSKSHLAIYFALLYVWGQQDFSIPVRVYSREIMPLAKVSSTSTFHSLIRQLNDYGYIQYIPSYYKGRPSEVYLKEGPRQGYLTNNQ